MKAQRGSGSTEWAKSVSVTTQLLYQTNSLLSNTATCFDLKWGHQDRNIVLSRFILIFVIHVTDTQGDVTHKNYGSTLSLNLVLDGVGGQRHVPAALPPGKRPGTHCIGVWVGSRAGLDGCGKSRLHRDSIPGTVQPVLTRYTGVMISP